MHRLFRHSCRFLTAKPQLSARRVNISAKMPADRRIDAAILQRFPEGFRTLSARTDKTCFRHRIQGDEVHVAGTAHTAFQHIGEMACLLRSVVFSGDQGVFKGYAPPGFRKIMPARGE